jgi:hypothetical protein
MSLERREGQPPQGIDLLMPVPDILLPHYNNDLGFYLRKEGTILYANKNLIVTDVEYEEDAQPDTGERYGTIYVHNTKNGLPNYAAEYTLTQDDLSIEGARTWEYKTAKDPFTQDIIIEAKEDRHFPPNEDVEGVQYSRKSIVDSYSPYELVVGEGDVLYDKKEADFDPKSKKTIKDIHKQLSRLPLGVAIKPLDLQ